MDNRYLFENKKLYHYLGKGLIDLLKEHECIVAGGAITSLFCNRDINDIDVYFRNKEQLIDFLQSIWNDSLWIITHTKKATLFVHNNEDCEKIKVQLIHFKYFDNVEDIFNTFDFDVCMGAYDFKTEEFILHDNFLKHNSQRLLKFNGNTAFPIVSALRVQKYEDKGYNISKPEYIRILLACMNLHIDNYEDLKEQMGGMYGVNYDKIFKDIIDNKGKFNLVEVIEKLKDLNLNDDYFKKPEQISFDDVDDLIYNIENTYKRDYFKFDDKYYIIRNNTVSKIIYDKNSLKDYYNEITINKYFKRKNNKLYKFVHKQNDKYFSFYDDKFEYKIGEIAIAEGNSYNDYNIGLYLVDLEDLSDSMYQGGKNSVLIELEVDINDLKRIEYNAYIFNKCRVEREVPREEYEKYLED